MISTTETSKLCFSHDQVTHEITALQFSSNYSSSAIWADTDIRLIVKITAQSVTHTVRIFPTVEDGPK